MPFKKSSEFSADLGRNLNTGYGVSNAQNEYSR